MSEDTFPKEGKKYGYARVSTKKQKVAMQVAALKEAGCDKIFIDRGVSAKVFPRRELSNVLKTLKPGDILVIYKLDRLARSVLHLAQLRELFEERNIHLHSLNQAIDFTTASGKLSYAIFSAFAEFESNINSERTKGGMAIKKNLGIHIGRPLKLSETEIQAAREMMGTDEFSLSAIARMFDVSANTMKRALK